ncbi:hypothetical protein HanRHA438_Chr11g0493941 [Helianthus annuus]|nr:hypothetical protein HanRHA438_Chr11g0493941 [Helianthus annuus]
MGGYVSHLQKQSFLTNLQALNCSASLGNNTKRKYNKLCLISLPRLLGVGSGQGPTRVLRILP